ncbi:uncharacterized protein V1513DRAFT_440271 [Lipomyces chichibuensis]|uniref:uncharacterized protein n=1 Tax=Lipomyces chichibuensis TaxID=1546026 RepID=UPI00334366C2
MAPTALEARSLLDKRQYYYGCSYYGTCSGWYYWGRWILLGVIIVAGLLLFWLFICMRNRRRSKAGLPPAYGTHWMGYGGGYNGHNVPTAPVQPQNTGPGAYYAGTYPQQGSAAPPAYTYNANYQQQPGVTQPGYPTSGPNFDRSGEAYEMHDYPPPTSPPPAATANGKRV